MKTKEVKPSFEDHENITLMSKEEELHFTSPS
jgi:hypothetical protein